MLVDSCSSLSQTTNARELIKQVFHWTLLARAKAAGPLGLMGLMGLMEVMLRTSDSTKKQVRTRVEDAVNGQATTTAMTAMMSSQHRCAALDLVAGGLSPFFRRGRLTAV
jgi:hypothetical protein